MWLRQGQFRNSVRQPHRIPSPALTWALDHSTPGRFSLAPTARGRGSSATCRNCYSSTLRTQLHTPSRMPAAPQLTAGAARLMALRFTLAPATALCTASSNQVVWAPPVIGLLHGRRNLVVGLGNNVIQPNCCGIVAPGAKWINAGHTEGLAPRLRRWI